MSGSVAAVLLAAGSGSRFEAGANKVFIDVLGRPLLAWAATPFVGSADVGRFVVVAAAGEVERCRTLLPGATVIRGGATRHESERLGIEALAPAIVAGEVDLVLVHDAARPFVTATDLQAVIAAARRTGAAIPALPAAPGVATVDAGGRVRGRLADLWTAQTPQGFEARLLLTAHRRAAAEGFEGTDTASVVERLGAQVVVVRGSPDNVKLTTPSDLALAEALGARFPGAAPLLDPDMLPA
ncbi:MAG: 2-C-methyl-D-erythritol 4-phosphate cytidylyltransferase [Candidatus Dormibacteraeota bacterium]|nr:2-C-methyl-D-erythritol 4-phosphate cytidylyltransferase [Candidatus Dormibacteraeota bacterium]